MNNRCRPKQPVSTDSPRYCMYAPCRRPGRNRRLRLAGQPGQVTIDQPPGSGAPRGEGRQLVDMPAMGLFNLAGLRDDLAAGVFGVETEHQGIGEGPVLAAEILAVAHVD